MSRAELQTKGSGHLTFHCINDYWGTHSSVKAFYGMPGVILCFNVHSVVIILIASAGTL